MRKPGLTELTDQPTLEVVIGNETLYFSELTIEGRGKLQSYIQAKIPHPMETVKAHMNGLSEDMQFRLLDAARKESANWPPALETQAGIEALTSTEGGQIELFFIGLQVHQPAMNRETARKIYRQLNEDARRSNDFATVQAIMHTIFGLPTPDEGVPIPKAESSSTNGVSTGRLSSDAVSKS